MPYAVLSDKVVNNKTRVDISVPSYKETEGPLGGISVEYVILVVAERKALDVNSSSNDIVEFKTLKSYRECEDFYTKLCNKHPDTTAFPELPKTFSHPCTPPENRLGALDQLMKFIGSTSHLCSSPQLLTFLDIEFTNGTAASSIAEQQEQDLDNNSIFKKVKVKNKQLHVADNNNDDNSDATPNVTSENENSESVEEDLDNMFKASGIRKRNETGSKPLFDELSLLKRSENLAEQELLLFDPKEYSGPISSAEADLFLIPGAREVPVTQDNDDDDTDDILSQLSVHDDLDQFLAKVNKQHPAACSTPGKPTGDDVSPEQTCKRPLPPSKPSVPSKPSKSLPLSEGVANTKVETAEKPMVPLKPIPAARNRGSRPVPQPRKNIETNTNKDHSQGDSVSMGSVDILKYIEDEQRNANAEPDLFS